jgi:phage terminase large subunit
MSLDYFDVADAIRAKPDDTQLLRDTLAAASPDARRLYVEAVATYRAMTAIDALVAAIDAQPDTRNAVIARADALQRADLLAVLKIPADRAIERVNRLRAIRSEWLERATEAQIAAIKTYYSAHIAAFCNDWGSSLNPKLTKSGEAIQPLILWPMQYQVIDMIWQSYRGQEPAVIAKSRDVGCTYVACASIVALALFTPGGFVALIGSATEDKLDSTNDSNTVFSKLRELLEYTPIQLRGGYTFERCSSDKKILIPETGALIRGGVGPQIGRSGRSSLCVIDEAAHVPFSDDVYKALSANTDAVVSMSSVAGTTGKFYQLWTNPAIRLKLAFPWTADPRKAAEPNFAERMIALVGRVAFECEYGINFLADAENTIILGSHLEACIDGDKRAGIECKGAISIGFDIGVSRDRSAIAVCKGTKVIHAESWASKPDQLKPSVQRIVDACDKYGVREFWYDAAGAGGFVPSILKEINEKRAERATRGESATIKGRAFQGGGRVFQPTRQIPGSTRTGMFGKGIKNEDYFFNLKAQSFGKVGYLSANSALLAGGADIDPSECLFIDGSIVELGRLKIEMCQPCWDLRSNGTRLVDKYNGGISPNLCDALVIALHPRSAGWNNISDETIAALGG